MKKINILWAIICLFVATNVHLVAQQNANLVVSGPMLGYIEHREALIWLEVSPEVKTIHIKYWQKNSPQTAKTAMTTPLSIGTYKVAKVRLESLEMNTVYEYEVILNGKKQTFTFATGFKTKELWEWRKDAPDFSFLLGSCFYINDPTYDRPGKPYGKDPRIMETMGNMPSDFMLWLGDNLYLREADYSSATGIAYRYSYNFKQPQMQKLRATRANYAIWDDHDYGPNDSDGKFELKETTLAMFKAYWGNKTFGEPDNQGIYHKFRWSDCDFFCMDDRFYRSSNYLPDSTNGKPNPFKQFYGRKQLDWLKNSLISSDASFKFIVTGGQMLNKMADKECFVHYPSEWNELIDFIVENKISGVIFISGDRHFSEMQVMKRNDFYPLFDFTCSAVTSGVHDISKTPEMRNPTRIAGSLLLENNFGKINVSGAKGDRKVQFETFDINGTSRWKFVISEKDLQVK